MKVRIVAGDVEVRLDGLDLTLAEVRSLLRSAATAARRVDPDEEPRAPIGFAATIERIPQDVERVEYYEEEE